MDIDEYNELKEVIKQMAKAKVEAKKAHRLKQRERYWKMKEDTEAYEEWKEKQLEYRCERKAKMEYLEGEVRRLKQENQYLKEMLRLAERME